MATPSNRSTMMKYFAMQYIEYIEEIANAANAPEPLPEHRAAVLALLRARGLLDDAAGRDERTDTANDGD